MRVTPIRTAAVLLVLTAGCAGSETAEPPAEAPPGATEHEAQDVPSATEPPAEAEYSCFGPAIPKSVWAAKEPATDVEHPGRSVLREELGPEGLGGWFLLEATADRLAVAREREVVREAGDDLLRTHDVVAVSDFGVEVVVGVRPHPATPFTLRLQQPLGERTLIDGSVYPARPLDPAPAEIQRV